MFDITYDLAFYDNDEHLRFGSLYMDAEKNRRNDKLDDNAWHTVSNEC